MSKYCVVEYDNKGNKVYYVEKTDGSWMLHHWLYRYERKVDAVAKCMQMNLPPDPPPVRTVVYP